MSFGDVAAAAIRFASEGFAVHRAAGDLIASHEAATARWPSNAAIFLPGGASPPVGDHFVQTDLGRHAAIHGRPGARGREARPARPASRRRGTRSTSGDIAETIVRYHEQNGGYLSRGRPRRLPLARSSRRCGATGAASKSMTCGPWCQGPTLLAGAALIEQRAASTGWSTTAPTMCTCITECLKLACADREYHYGDPLFVDVRLDEPAVARHARPARRIDAAGHAPMPRHAAAAGPADGDPPAAGRQHAAAPRLEPDTSYCCAVDRWGNAMSATPSDGSSRSPVMPGPGHRPLRPRLAEPARPVAIPPGVAPGKRPRLTPNPAIVADATTAA